MPDPGAPQVVAPLIGWYRAHRRELPWRETTDPYRIWISEVILQQTRVAQGLGYYLRFVGRFPDVRTLAEAPEDDVLRHWQGLGYYSRARNLHAAARQIVERFGGTFPATHAEVLSLPGIGSYTAAAICSIAYRQPYAVVDGNLYRVLSRLFDIDLPIDSGQGQRYFAALAQELLDTERPDLHNQAMMEFGALQCVPRSPRCTECPLSDRCLALARGRVEQLPVKKGRTEVKARYFNYLDLRCGAETVLVQRTGHDIWRGLYEYPLIETDREVEFDELLRTEAFRNLFAKAGKPALPPGAEPGPVPAAAIARAVAGDHATGRIPEPDVFLPETAAPRFVLERTVVMPRHQLSHRTIHARFHRLRFPEGFPPLPDGFLRVAPQALDRYPVSRLITLYREQ